MERVSCISNDLLEFESKEFATYEKKIFHGSTFLPVSYGVWGKVAICTKMPLKKC